MTDKNLSTMLGEKKDAQSYPIENIDAMFSGAHGAKLWYGSFFFDILLILWLPWIFAIPYVIQDCLLNFLWSYWKWEGEKKRRYKWYSTFNLHNWRWFWRVQKHRVNYNISTSYDKKLGHVAKFLSTLKKTDWTCEIIDPTDLNEPAPIIYVSFRRKADAVQYKMMF